MDRLNQQAQYQGLASARMYVCGSLESPAEQCTEPNRRQKETLGHKAFRKKGQFEVMQSDDNGAENILLTQCYWGEGECHRLQGMILG